MKKVSILGLMMFLVAAGAFAQPAGSVLLKWETLWAGQFMYAGEFQVYATSTGLYIRLFPVNPWLITEAHVTVHLSPCDIPTTKDCAGGVPKGNPIPGHFEWSEKTCPQTDPYEFEIPYSSIGSGPMAGQTLYMAVHAVVVQGYYLPDTPPCNFFETQNETSWGGPCANTWAPGDPLPAGFYKLGKSSWGYYLSFQLPNPLP